MADKRMISKKVIHSDDFMDLPATTKNLYFYLMIEADDDGFVNSPKRIQRMVGGTDDDAKLLLAKKFIISFESGVIVIKHWRMHNYIRSDRYKVTTHTKEAKKLSLKDNGVYTLDTVGRPLGIPVGVVDKSRLDKSSAVKFQPTNLSDDEAISIINYRKSIKSPLKSQRGYTGLENKITSVMDKFSLSLEKVLEIMSSKEWKSVDIEWVKKEGYKTGSKQIKPASELRLIG